MALLVNVWFYMFCNILLNILLFTDFESKRARRRFRSDEKYINILFSILLEGETESLQTQNPNCELVFDDTRHAG